MIEVRGTSGDGVPETSVLARSGSLSMTPSMLPVCLGGLLAAIVVSADGPTLLQLGRPTERALSGAETHAYGLALDAGQVARLTVVQKGIDVIVHVRDAQGTLLADFNLESRTEGREPLIVLGEAAGPVQIGIAARYPRLPGGTYAIQVDTIQPASERDSQAPWVKAD